MDVNFKNIFNHETESVESAGFLLSFFALLSAALGVLRNSLLASHFGAGPDLDTYYAAFRIPDFIYNILIIGSVSAAFIPLFNKFLSKSRDEAWQFANNILTILLFILLATAIILFIFAPFVMKIIVPGFNGEQISKTAALTRMLMIQPILLGLSSVIGGCLQSFKRFFVNAITPVLYNLGIIAGIVVLAPLFGIKGVAIGVIIGALCHFLIQFLTFKNLGFKPRFVLDFKSGAVRDMFFLMLPRLLTLLSGELVAFVYLGFASKMASGSLSIFNFASSIQSFPAVVFGVSFAVAAFPSMAQLRSNREEFLNIVKKTVQKIIILLLPITAFYIIFRNLIIELLLGYGKFNVASQTITADVLLVFSFGILANGLLPFLARVFFSLENTKIPFLASVFSSILAISLAAIFAGRLGPVALALAMVCGNWINILILSFIFWKKILPKI